MENNKNALSISQTPKAVCYFCGPLQMQKKGMLCRVNSGNQEVSVRCKQAGCEANTMGIV